MTVARRAGAPARRQPRKPNLKVVLADSAPLADVPRGFKECRALGHEWSHVPRPLPSEDEPHRPLGTDRDAVAFRSACTVCGTGRIKWLSRSGNLGGTSYTYPEGYQRIGPDAHVERSDWRRAWVIQALTD